MSPRAGGPGAIKLLAQDEEDLTVVASLLQDAVVKVSDITYLPNARRFAMVLNRFVWEAGLFRRRPMRVRAGLHVDQVLAARSLGIPQKSGTTVLSLMTLRLEKTDDHDHIRLIFSGGGEILLQVDGSEVQLRDLSAPWPARRRPEHDDNA